MITSTSLTFSDSVGPEVVSVPSSSSSSSSSPSSMGPLLGTWLLLWSLSFLLFFFLRTSEGSLDRGRWMWWEEWRWSGGEETGFKMHQLDELPDLMNAETKRRQPSYIRCPPRGSCGAVHQEPQQQGWGSAGSVGRPKLCSGPHHPLHRGAESRVVMRRREPLAATPTTNEQINKKNKETNKQNLKFGDSKCSVLIWDIRKWLIGCRIDNKICSFSK